MGILDDITEGVKGAYQKAKEAVQGPAQQAADTTGLSDINVPDVAPEASDTTTTGGKRVSRRKTRRGKKSKKTRRHRKY
jgi:hypothetical protein